LPTERKKSQEGGRGKKTGRTEGNDNGCRLDKLLTWSTEKNKNKKKGKRRRAEKGLRFQQVTKNVS